MLFTREHERFVTALQSKHGRLPTRSADDAAEFARLCAEANARAGRGPIVEEIDSKLLRQFGENVRCTALRRSLPWTRRHVQWSLSHGLRWAWPQAAVQTIGRLETKMRRRWGTWSL